MSHPGPRGKFGKNIYKYITYDQTPDAIIWIYVFLFILYYLYDFQVICEFHAQLPFQYINFGCKYICAISDEWQYIYIVEPEVDIQRYQVNITAGSWYTEISDQHYSRKLIQRDSRSTLQ